MTKQDISDWRVLIVDDEFDSIEVLMMVLTASGAQVVYASNGVEGLALFKAERPTLILTDLSMPEMDGWQMLNEIRRIDNNHHKTPVIALTAHAMAGDQELVMKQGFDGYLSKPLKLFTLLDDLKQIVGKQ